MPAPALLASTALVVLAAVTPIAWIDRLPDVCLLRLAGIGACPGCGMTHALWWLLHGEPGRAFASNPRVVLVAPLLLWLAVKPLWSAPGLRSALPRAVRSDGG